MSSSTAPRGELPKVSILIPTYEQDDVIMDAVSSALAQDYPNLEVLVIDDASPRARYEAVRGIRDCRLRFVRNEHNLGRVRNYRHGLYDLASGEWVVNLDGDDFFTDPSFISRAVHAASADPSIVIVSARCTTWHRRGRVVSPTPGSVVIAGTDLVAHLPHEAYLFMHLATLYRRDPAMAINFYRRPVISADWESLYRLAVRGRVAFIDRDVGVWRIHQSNASGTGDWRSLADNLQIWPSILADAVDLGLPQRRARAALRRCLVKFGRLQMPSVMRSRRQRDVFRYLAAFGRIDPKSMLLALASGATLARLAIGLLGYYRKRAF